MLLYGKTGSLSIFTEITILMRYSWNIENLRNILIFLYISRSSAYCKLTYPQLPLNYLYPHSFGPTDALHPNWTPLTLFTLLFPLLQPSRWSLLSLFRLNLKENYCLRFVFNLHPYDHVLDFSHNCLLWNWMTFESFKLSFYCTQSSNLRHHNTYSTISSSCLI